jgi:hypothetical protein
MNMYVKDSLASALTFINLDIVTGGSKRFGYTLFG